MYVDYVRVRFEEGTMRAFSTRSGFVMMAECLKGLMKRVKDECKGEERMGVAAQTAEDSGSQSCLVL